MRRAPVLAVAQRVAGNEEPVLGYDAAAVVVREDKLMILAQGSGLLEDLKAAGGEGDDMLALRFHAPAGCRIIAGNRPGLSPPVHLLPPCFPRLGRANGRQDQNSKASLVMGATWPLWSFSMKADTSG